MKLIVGLGNPGKEYENTRHNAGFKFIDKFASSLNLNFNKEKFGGLYTEFNYQNEKIILLKPQKYINLSGEVLIKFKDFYKIFYINKKFSNSGLYEVYMDTKKLNLKGLT